VQSMAGRTRHRGAKRTSYWNQLESLVLSHHWTSYCQCHYHIVLQKISSERT
jgi:hypothetical protein